MTVNVHLPAAFRDLFTPARYKVYYGGRGSGKSWAFATALIVRATTQPVRILCTRELQNSIGDSVHRLLSDTITRLGLEAHFDVLQTEIRGRSGSLFLFEGLRFNVRRIKSLEGIDLCWVEEGDAVSNPSWDLLVPTIRRPGSEIWISFNRDLEDDPCYVRFVENAPAGAIVRMVTWNHNPWLPKVLRDEMRYDMARDPERFEHVWSGAPWSRTDAQVFSGKYRVEEFETPEDADFYLGMDFGFSHDPDTIVRCFVDEQRLFVDAEVYAHQVPILDTPSLLDAILPDRRWPVRADSARPEVIDFLNGEGFNIISAHKGPGSVEDGLRFLLSFEEIVVHPRCKRLIEELRLYSYKTDPRTGDVLPIIKPGHDHLIDALRYSLEEVWHSRQGSIGNYNTDMVRELGI